MGASDIIDLVKNLGPFLTLIVYIIARDHHREHRLDGRVDELNKFVRGELMKALKRNNELLSRWRTPIYPEPSNRRSIRLRGVSEYPGQSTGGSVDQSTI